MLRGIDNLEALLWKVWIDLGLHDAGDVFVIDFFAKCDGLARFVGFWSLNGELIWEGGKDLKHSGDLGWDKLAAGLIVDLVSVIFLWVMGSSNHDAPSGFHSANGEGKLWDWAESIEDIGLDSHLVENLGGEKGELTGFEAVVVGDNNTHILGARDLLDKIHAEGNRGFLDGEVIHLVGAWTNEAAHTGGSEFDVFEEGGVFLFRSQSGEGFLVLFADLRRGHPSFIVQLN